MFFKSLSARAMRPYPVKTIEQGILCAGLRIGRAHEKARRPKGERALESTGYSFYFAVLGLGIGTSIFSAVPVGGVTTTRRPAVRSASLPSLPSMVTTVLA